MVVVLWPMLQRACSELDDPAQAAALLEKLQQIPPKAVDFAAATALWAEVSAAAGGQHPTELQLPIQRCQNWGEMASRCCPSADAASMSHMLLLLPLCPLQVQTISRNTQLSDWLKAYVHIMAQYCRCEHCAVPAGWSFKFVYMNMGAAASSHLLGLSSSARVLIALWCLISPCLQSPQRKTTLLLLLGW
jgi:hypothetical protein